MEETLAGSTGKTAERFAGFFPSHWGFSIFFTTKADAFALEETLAGSTGKTAERFAGFFPSHWGFPIFFTTKADAFALEETLGDFFSPPGGSAIPEWVCSDLFRL